MTMRTFQTVALATLLILAVALAGCTKQEEEVAKTPQEIMPGLTYVDSLIGDGEEVQIDDFVMVHYTGWLFVDGAKTEQFDSSVERGEPIGFPLGRSFVIQGWEKGIPGMKVGGKRTLYIEPDMGYGAEGRPPVIPPNTTLVFDVEIVDIPKVDVEILAEGSGPVVEPGDNISVDYTGWVWVDGAKGEEFDSSKNAGRPYNFTLGARMVIPGWDIGLEGMKVGTKARLIIPPVLAYGKRGSGPKIPPDATLCFEVELVEKVEK
jgi:FKBP-type peptidyl-prolyl cis-trans isomerase